MAALLSLGAGPAAPVGVPVKEAGDIRALIDSVRANAKSLFRAQISVQTTQGTFRGVVQERTQRFVILLEDDGSRTTSGKKIVLQHFIALDAIVALTVQALDEP